MEHFRIARYRFYLRAGEKGLDLPAFKGSALRGVMGRVMRGLSCVDMGRECAVCRLYARCPYAYVFETRPSPVAGMMKGYEQVPRPYTIEPFNGSKDRLAAGEEMHFDLLLYGQAIPLFPYFIHAFQEGGRIGLGAGKKTYRLERVEAINDCTDCHTSVFSYSDGRQSDQAQEWSGRDIIMAASCLPPVKQITVEFLTPTQLMADRQKLSHLEKLEFGVLMRNIFRRYSSLYVHHHNLRPEENYHSMLEISEQVECLGGEGRVEQWERYSTRHDRRNQMEGFVGQVSFRGDLDLFLPYLLLGQYLHMGKWTVMGMGRYACRF